jgi:hypothetical protein
LVKEFGYDKEPRINKMVLNNTKNEYNSTQPQDKETLNHLFAEKDYNGYLQIREGLLQTVTEETNAEQNDLFKILDDYCFYLVFNDNAEQFFNFNERCQIIACINNTIYPLYTKYSLEAINDVYWDNQNLLHVLCIQKPEIIAEIIKNSYFGFSNLKKYIEQENYGDKTSDEDELSMLIIPNKKPKMLGGHILVDPY